MRGAERETPYREGKAYTSGETPEGNGRETLHRHLVSRFRAELAKARRGTITSIGEEGKGERQVLAFNTAEWLRKQLFDAQAAADYASAPQEDADLYYNLSFAWDAVAYDRLSEKGRKTASYGAIEYVIQEKRDSVPLPPKGVNLLDAMAEVADLPDYQPGRTEISLPLETMLSESIAAGLRRNNVKKG